MALVPKSSVSIPLCNLPLRPSSLATFQQRGFVMSQELEQSKSTGGITNLAAELGVSLTEAVGLLREVHGAIQSTSNNTSDGQGTTAQEALLRSSSSSQTTKSTTTTRRNNRNIISFSQSVDNLLGGGIALGEVTEIAGLPGVGKTQLAMQLCVDARLISNFGGVEGESVYIDTEGSFSPERCFTMAREFVNHIHGTARRRNNLSVPDWFQAERILDGIHVYRVHDEAAQTATIVTLPTFLEQRAQAGTPVRLIVIDSIAFHYRCAPERWDYVERTKNLSSMASCLADIANKFDVAVVAINQMTTKFGGGPGGEQMQLVPALGESWAHSTTTRLLLSIHPSNPSIRKCSLVKSPHKPSGTATYQVLECGIRDAPVPGNPSPRMASAATVSNSKRKRPH